MPKRTRRQRPAQAPPAVATLEKKMRGIRVVDDDPDSIPAGIEWSGDSGALGVMIYSIDHKDRWLVSVDLGAAALVMQQRMTDPAWIDHSFNEFGWLNDNRTLWYESEESGYAHLYAKPINGEAKALPHGQFEGYTPQLSEDGRWFYVLSNQV